MIVGVPKETKAGERRVAVTPSGARELVGRGHQVWVEEGAGAGSGISDEEYLRQGARLVDDSEEVLSSADLIVKVKEPLEEEAQMFHEGQILFTYLHLAAHADLADILLDSGVTAIAYETVRLTDGRLPLLAPMSQIAGRMAVQVAAALLEGVSREGRGVLLSGVPGVSPAKLVVIGAGVAGGNAALLAGRMGARVVALDKDPAKLHHLEEVGQGRLTTLASSELAIEGEIRDADAVIGAVLVPGSTAPKVLTAEMVAFMPVGAVLVDLAIDQGGCFETSRETTHDDPVYLLEGRFHYAVGNVPGSVPRTSTAALANATLSYVVELADSGVRGAMERRPELKRGINVENGAVVHPAVARSLKSDSAPSHRKLEGHSLR